MFFKEMRAYILFVYLSHGTVQRPPLIVAADSDALELDVPNAAEPCER